MVRLHQVFVGVLVLCLTFSSADAGCRKRARRACQAAPVQVQATPQASPQSSPQAYAPQIQASDDPSGFLGWLNAIRAQHGLHAVGHDPNLSAWAQVNNGHQHARGMGHHVMGSARRQNAGMGQGATVWAMWMQSAPHRAALLDPNITVIGIAASGSYWTFNAY